MVYKDNELDGQFFVESSERTSENVYDIQCHNYTGILESNKFYGGIYFNVLAKDIIKLLLDIHKKCESTLIVVTHDERLIYDFDKVIRYDDFIRIETINDSDYYYIDTDVADGSYSFIFFADDSRYLFHVDNNKLTDMELINDSVPCFASGKWVISCTGHNCFVGTCVPLDQEVALGCSPCHITDEQHWCETHISGSGGGDTPWLGIISIILGIIGIIVAL